MTNESTPQCGFMTLDRKRFARFSAFITRELGIRMPEAKLTMLQSRLQRRLRLLQIGSLDAYEEYLFRSDHTAEELVHFIDLVTTNKTDFFREPQHFEYLRSTALPALAREAGAPERWDLRVWCAGCSSGQEAYTLAMVLSEYAEAHPGFSFSVLATDVSTQVLKQACAAIYPEELIDPVPLELRKKYLLRSKDRSRKEVCITPQLRARVRFGRLNFMEENYGLRDKFDLVLFRNVMIYFDKPTQELIVNRLCQHLKPGGFFFISHSESLMGLEVPLKLASNSVFRRTR
jgi:chemotaxis protein methyltransferase CheR